MTYAKDEELGIIAESIAMVVAGTAMWSARYTKPKRLPADIVDIVPTLAEYTGAWENQDPSGLSTLKMDIIQAVRQDYTILQPGSSLVHFEPLNVIDEPYRWWEGYNDETYSNINFTWFIPTMKGIGRSLQMEDLPLFRPIVNTEIIQYQQPGVIASVDAMTIPVFLQQLEPMLASPGIYEILQDICVPSPCKHNYAPPNPTDQLDGHQGKALKALMIAAAILEARNAFRVLEVGDDGGYGDVPWP